jgi:hypothetical protein
VGPGVTPQHYRFGRTIRQRKFPGPAGLLPDKVSGALASVIDKLNINVMAFCKVMSCSLVDVYQHFGRTCCLCLYGRSGKIMASCFSEALINLHIYQIKWCNISEDHNLNIYHYKNLRSQLSNYTGQHQFTP